MTLSIYAGMMNSPRNQSVAKWYCVVIINSRHTLYDELVGLTFNIVKELPVLE
jgi:hypothetical protein